MQKVANAKVDDDVHHHPSCKKKVCQNLKVFDLLTF